MALGAARYGNAGPKSRPNADVCISPAKERVESSTFIRLTASLRRRTGLYFHSLSIYFWACSRLGIATSISLAYISLYLLAVRHEISFTVFSLSLLNFLFSAEFIPIKYPTTLSKLRFLISNLYSLYPC